MLEPDIDIRAYEGQKTAEFKLDGLCRVGRVDQVEDELWIISNDPECFSHIPTIEHVAKAMAEILEPFGADCLMAAATRAIITAYKVAEILGHENLAVARKSISPAPTEILRVETRSITSGEGREMMIDGETRDIVRGRRVVIFDDVISEGGTMRGLKQLAEMSEAEVVGTASIAIEGSTPYTVFKDDLRDGTFAFLTVLPLFATGGTLEDLMRERDRVLENFRN